MEFEGWQGLIFYIASTMALIIFSDRKTIKDWIARNIWGSFKASDAIETASEVLDVIWHAEKSTNPINRVAVLRAGNGGSVPRIGKEMKVTMLYNSYDVEERNKKKEYKNIECDHHYIRMLVDITKEGSVQLDVDKMYDGAMLKNIYASEGIKYSEVHYITETEKYIYFVSYATSQDGERFEMPQTRNTIYLTTQRLKKIFTENVVD